MNICYMCEKPVDDHTPEDCLLCLRGITALEKIHRDRRLILIALSTVAALVLLLSAFFIGRASVPRPIYPRQFERGGIIYQ